MHASLRTLFATVLALCATTAARADVVVSTAQTQNMSCANGVCAPTASNAVLSVNDLQSYLAAGNIEVTTTGSGVEANNIWVKVPLAWSNASTLALQAYQSIAVSRHVSVTGLGGLSIVINNGGSGGTFSTGPKGRVSFANLSSALTINGASYTLVNSVKSLAAAVANNASGDYALADNYDAKQDGTYSNTPVPTELTGTVEGLGNTISNITVDVARGAHQLVGGLFYKINRVSEVGAENLTLTHLRLTMAPYTSDASQLAGGLAVAIYNSTILFNDHVSGTINVDAEGSFADSTVGGLVSANYGFIESSSSTVKVRATDADPGGVAGYNALSISDSWESGDVTLKNDQEGDYVGGFDGAEDVTSTNSYAVGEIAVAGSMEATGLGGLTATTVSDSSDTTSYFAGKISGQGDYLGGFIGEAYGGTFQNCYWDTTTSGTDDGVGDGNVAGITGLTTKQFKSGLPTGFDPTIWAEDKKINHGFPYLIANPPPDSDAPDPPPIVLRPSNRPLAPSHD